MVAWDRSWKDFLFLFNVSETAKHRSGNGRWNFQNKPMSAVNDLIIELLQYRVYVKSGPVIVNVDKLIAALQELSGGAILPWVPVDVSGAGLIYTLNDGRYIDFGPLVWISTRVKWPINANGLIARIGGLPFNSSPTIGLDTFIPGLVRSAGPSTANILAVNPGVNTASPQTLLGGALTNANMSNNVVQVSGFYPKA